MPFAHRANTNKIRLLTFLTPLKNKIMKNPQIATKLNRMMAEEKQAKINVISTILDSYKQNNEHLDVVAEFDRLYELDLAQLNDILSDIISELYHQINKKLNLINKIK